MSKLQVYNGKEWVEIAKNGKDAVVDYDYILSQIPKPKDGADGFVDDATIAYLEDKIDNLAKTTKHTNFGRVIREIQAGNNITVDNSDPNRPVIASTGGGSGHTIEDEGTPLTTRTKLNFVGAGVSVTDDSGDDATVVTINGGGELYTNYVILESPDTTRWEIAITNNGELTATVTLDPVIENVILIAPDTTRWTIGITNNGELTATPI